MVSIVKTYYSLMFMLFFSSSLMFGEQARMFCLLVKHKKLFTYNKITYNSTTAKEKDTE
jgi:hypothetical protein